METIVAAALRIPTPHSLRVQTWNGKPLYPDHLIITAPPPARHPSLLHPINDVLDGNTTGPVQQGFLTSTGRYVDRKEALQIVLASGQPQIDHPAKNAGDKLFSEDLW